jgi:hypothetical protein
MKQKAFFIGLALTTVLLTSEKAVSQYAFAGKQITLNGYDLLTDSYDSADPNRSTGGFYDPAKGSGDRGNVGAEAGIFNSVGVGNVSIWGTLSAAAQYSLEIGPESSIGSLAWHVSGQPGIEPGALITGFSWQFPSPILPPTLWMTCAGGTFEGETYTYILSTGDFEVSSLHLSGGEKLLVTGAARLYVPDDLDIKGTAAIRILPSASLKLYVGAPTANLRGNGILNEGAVSHFQYYGLAGNNTINLRLTTGMAGLIYAPHTACYITTKGNAVADFQGALVVQELDLGAPLRLHYDEALSR